MLCTRLLSPIVLSVISEGLPISTSLLEAISQDRPDRVVFPSPPEPHHVPPFRTEIAGAKQTNKFWSNWAVEEGRWMPIYPMPYVLQMASPANLMISRCHDPMVVYGDNFTNGAEKIRYYFSPTINEFGMGTAEETNLTNLDLIIVKEGLFGIHAQLRGQGRNITFPIYSGMTYVSGLYQGYTPQITSTRAIVAVDWVRNGTWSLRNNGGKEFRLYALQLDGHFVDASIQFGADGRMNQVFTGRLRLAEVQAESDREVLDAHATAVLVDWDLDVETGLVKYSFRKNGDVDTPLLHFAYAHHQKLLVQQEMSTLQPMLAPTKGHMAGVIGDTWLMQIDMSKVNQLGFLLPARADDLAPLALEQLAEFEDGWRQTILRGSYYFSGKGFQKIGSLCLLLEDFYGTNHRYTQLCSDILVKGFRCFYIPGEPDCSGAPIGSYYESEWGGIASKEGFGDSGCRTADFGNACYNDHHFHFGYFVVAAAMLVKLRPEYASDVAFTSYVETLIRDTTNPSIEDSFFPAFRSFDWFDLHSWSRGVVPSPDGKDQESTSEELNLLYGIQLWGRVTRVGGKLEQLGATMLALCIMTVQEFFLMKVDNLHHPKDFAQNHVTGIFFQNKVDYATWFGWKIEYIHGIQMLPLTPALVLARSPEFCQEEWDHILSKLPLPATDPWTSIIITGTLAMINSTLASDYMVTAAVDDGLTRVWAQYWIQTAQESHRLFFSTTTSTTRTSLSTSTFTELSTSFRSADGTTEKWGQESSGTDHLAQSVFLLLAFLCKELLDFR